MNTGTEYRRWAWKRVVSCTKKTDERGIALITVILLIMVLSFVSATAIVISTTELKIGGNFKTSVQSFYNAEAGIQYALGQIRNLNTAGALTLTGTPVIVHYGAPNTSVYPLSVYPLLSNNMFPFSNWTTTRLYLKAGTTNYYNFTVTGSYANSRTQLQALLNVPTALLTPGMSATNNIVVGNNFTLNGSLAGGSTVTQGNNATITGGTVTPNATLVADPLDSVFQVSTHNYIASNNNTGVIAGTSINGNKTLPPGNYHLTNVTNANLTISGSGAVNIYLTDNSVTLDGITINPGSGPVNIYYHGTGTFTFGNNSNINSGGDSGNLSIICDTAPLFDFANSLSFSGFLYVPYADVIFGNTANFTGLLRAKTITAGNNLNFTYSAPNASLAGGPPILISWKQL